MRNKQSFSRSLILAIMGILFLTGILLIEQTTVWARQALYNEHDKHLWELASTVDHNISVVFDRCRTELHNLVTSESFYDIERQSRHKNDSAVLERALRKSAVLLTDYANRIVAFEDGKAVLSTVKDDCLDYTILADTDGDDIWLCIDNKQNKSYAALSCPSETTNSVYYVLIDLEPFFRRVAVDTIYEDHWIVLYDAGSGLTLQNDNNQPEYNLFAKEDILQRNDGYTRIYEHEQSGITGASEYTYLAKDRTEQTIRILVIPSSKSENGIFTVAVAVYNEHIAVPMKRMTVNSILAAILIAFSAAAATFMLMHSGRREKELAREIDSLEKQKQLSDELVKNQEQLVHHQKLETIGTLTAGIAHEFNNLLSPIMGNSMLILEKSRTTDPQIFDNALEIYEASDRARELVLNISKLSRRQSITQMKPVLPAKLISDVFSMSAASIPGNINVKKAINSGSYILGDENQLEHMILNLVINAVQAMKPNGGTLTVSVDSDCNNVYISVSDTGNGIAVENLEAIFDPFFTTKEAGKGTGLGLSIAQRTATNHGGCITAANLSEGGAKFTFTTHIFKQ